MKKKLIAMFLVASMAVTMLAGCKVSTSKEGDGESTEEAAGEDITVLTDEELEGREEITMWFWGAEPYAQEAMKEILVDKYNASQDEYQLVVEFRPSVDSDMTTALAANQGPDIVYGSGPAFVMPLVEAGKLENLDEYSKQYGWEDKILQPYYESGTVNGNLYSLVNGVSTMGVFYNTKVLEDNGWAVPTTIEEMEAIMDEALEKVCTLP